jgi:tetratricopeptide (TPR) repeat protein
MAIRKEQVLALVTLAVGALVGKRYFEEGVFPTRVTPKKLEYAPKPVTAPPLVTAAAPAVVRRDFLTEPSETRPLPPRTLAFPPRAPLSLATIALEIGPDLRHAYAVRVDGAQVSGVTLGGDAATPAAADAGAAPAAPDAPAQSDLEQARERAALTYDRVWIGNQPQPFFGTIEPDPRVDLFQLEARPDFEGVNLRFRPFELSKGKYGATFEVGDASKQPIARIALANTLRNEITRRERKVPAGTAGLVERRALIGWLLERARETAWVWDVAKQHADQYRQDARGDLEGLRLMRRVLRAGGDLKGELEMLEALPQTGFEGAFRFEGLGIVKARLGLWQEAEADLRQATVLAPSDARPHAALAEFLRLRGRSDEAVRSARRAEQAFQGMQDVTEQGRVARVIVACRLAVGDVAAARAALALVPKDAPQPYLEGCVHYAAGDAAAALQSFRAAGGGPDDAVAALGRNACLAWQGQLAEAYDGLLQLYDREPLQRHRAAAAIAWTLVRTSQFEQAVVWIDRALEANPQDPFPYYLRGRALRLAGHLAGAVDALNNALQRRDDFVHAIAEMAAVQSELALQARGEEQVTAAVAARRYGDRAVALARPAPSAELLELQGLYAFTAADPNAAKAAFARARDASDEAHKGFGKGAIAVVDYSRGRVDDALTVLSRMVQDINAKDDPLGRWASERVAEIEDHARKEWLADGFDRDEQLGAMWLADIDGSVVPKPQGSRLVFRGSLAKGTASAERYEAIKRAKNFLAVAVTMQLGPAHGRDLRFTGLQIETQRGGAGGIDCQVQLGVVEHKPVLRIVDGRDAGGENKVQVPLDLPGLDLTKPQELELRVVPRGDDQSKQLTLLASWNGIVVHRHELKMLNGSSPQALKTTLLVEGARGGAVDVAFDDYRLERRKEQ